MTQLSSKPLQNILKFIYITLNKHDFPSCLIILRLSIFLLVYKYIFILFVNSDFYAKINTK